MINNVSSLNLIQDIDVGRRVKSLLMAIKPKQYFDMLEIEVNEMRSSCRENRSLRNHLKDTQVDFTIILRHQP